MKPRSKNQRRKEAQISEEELTILEQSITAALPVVEPTPAFVATLEHELMAESQRFQESGQRRARWIRALGVLAGGGFLAWRYWRAQNEPEEEKNNENGIAPAPLPAG